MTKPARNKKTKVPYENELRAAYDKALTQTGLLFSESQFARIQDAFRTKAAELLSKDPEKEARLDPEKFVDDYMDRSGEHILNKLQTSGLYTFAFERHQVGLDVGYLFVVSEVSNPT